MFPIHQPTDFSCLRACVASVLNLPINEVPNFVKREIGNDYWINLTNWLKLRGYSLDITWQAKLAYGIAIVKYLDRPHYKNRHAVVTFGDMVVFDPKRNQKYKYQILRYLYICRSTT